MPAPALPPAAQPAATPTASEPDNMRGIAAMLCAMCCFVVSDSLTKSAGAEIPVGQAIAMRCAVGGVLLLPIVLWQGVFAHLRQAYCRPMLLRNIGEIGGSLLFISALMQLPIANATAIMQTSPLTITAAAALFLGDPVGWRRWTATLVGLVGVIIIVNPGGAGFDWWYIPALIAVGFVTLRDLATRYIPRSTPTLFVTFLTFVVTFCGASVLGLTETWIMPSAAVTAKMTGAGIGLIGGYSLLIIALRSGETAAIIPFRYSIVLWSMLAGYIGWGHVPSAQTLLGIAIVVGAGVYAAHRERVRRREAQRAARDRTGP